MTVGEAIGAQKRLQFYNHWFKQCFISKTQWIKLMGITLDEHNKYLTGELMVPDLKHKKAYHIYRSMLHLYKYLMPRKEKSA